MFRSAGLFLAFALLRVAAQPLPVPEAEMVAAPTPARLDAELGAARRGGWGPQVPTLREAALRAYRQAPLSAAEAWFHLYAWSALFSEKDSDFTVRWMAAVNAAKVGHPNMRRTYTTNGVPLGSAISPDLQSWLLRHEVFSAEFFSVLSPVDHLPTVFSILQSLFDADEKRFAAYASLALAIAVVDDVPPPPNWPHGQVSASALPRQFATPAASFTWWIRQDQAGQLYRPLGRMPADELKYVVDASAPFAELEWARDFLPLTVGELPKAYDLVRYRQDRVKNNQPVWPGSSYALIDILRTGGICADQAYFAAQVGKAHGAPTLFFHGAGNDGRHAWFGYLDPDRRWQLDAGRYAEQRFVTGFATDPQTWREISDHELQFLKEHFRMQASYRQSRVHGAFAADLLLGNDVAGALAAARKAVQFEPKNQDAWETLVTATRRQEGATRAEAVLREAALAFRRYPDLEAFYVARVADSLRARGQTSAAEEEIRRIIRKNETARVDISVQEARDQLLRTFAEQPVEVQVAQYNRALDALGRGAGMAFFDHVVTVFVEHLMQLHHSPEAFRALERAHATMDVRPNSQLETEFNRLREAIQTSR